MGNERGQQAGILDSDAAASLPKRKPCGDIFSQLRFDFHRQFGQDRYTSNPGFGYRRLYFDNTLLGGVNVFYDREWRQAHNRLGVGAEVKWNTADLAANYYYDLSGKRTVANGVTEQPLNGNNIELTNQLPYLPWARARHERPHPRQGAPRQRFHRRTDQNRRHHFTAELGMRPMKRLILAALAALGAAFMLTTQAMAQVAGDATVYIISVTKIELCSSSACGHPVILGSGSKSFDIASIWVGAAIGTYADTNGLPNGRTFSHIRSTMLRTIQISGNAGVPGGVPGGDCITDGTAGATNSGAVLNAGGAQAVSNLVVPDILGIGGVAPTAGQYAAQGITLVDATSFQFPIALSSPHTVGDTPPNIDIAFQTQNAVGAADDGANNCEMFPQPPVVTITIN